MKYPEERNDMQPQIYDSLYTIVQQNMEAAGAKLQYRRATLLCDVEADPQIIDVSRFLELSNPEFMQAIHVAALKRLPDDRTAAFWEQRYTQPREEFQRDVLRTIAGSSVVAINHIRIVNNPYFEQKRGLKYHLMGLLYGLTDKSSLREFGKKLPMPIQSIIRKVFI